MARCSLNWTLSERDSSSAVKRLPVNRHQEAVTRDVEVAMLPDSTLMQAWPAMSTHAQPAAATTDFNTMSATNSTELRTDTLQHRWTAERSVPTPINLKPGRDSATLVAYAKPATTRLSTLVPEYTYNSRTQREELTLVYGAAPSRTTRAMAQGFAPTMVTTQMPATAVMVKEEQLRYQITPTDVLFGQYLFPFVTPLPNFVVDSGESRMSREPSIAKADCDDARGPLDQTSVATEQPEIGEGGCNTDDDESTVFEDCDNNDEGDSDSDSDSDFFPSSAKRRISTGSTSSLPLAVHRKKVQKANHLSSDVPAPRKGTTKDNRRTSIVKLKTATPLQRDTATTTTTTATTTTTTTTMTTIQEDPVYRCRFPGCDQICSAEESWSLHEGTHDKAEMYPFQCGVCTQSYVDLDPLRSHLYRDHPIYDKEGNLVSNAYDRAEVAASLRRQFHCAICRSSSRSSSSSSSSSRNNSRSNSRNSRSRSQSSSSTNSVAFLEGNDRGEDEEQEDAAVVAHATNNFKRRLAGIYVSGYRLRRHILDVHGPHRRFSCPDKCQLAFSTQDALDRHLANPGDWHDEKE